MTTFDTVMKAQLNSAILMRPRGFFATDNANIAHHAAATGNRRHRSFKGVKPHK